MRIMILIAVLLLLIPTLLLTWLWRARFRSRAEWLLGVLLVGAYVLFFFLAGRWDFFSYYLRFLIPLLFLAAAYRSFRRMQPAPTLRRLSISEWFGVIGRALLLGLLAWACVRAIGGRSHPEAAVDLAFPLRHGTYYVGGGGNARLINNHQAYPPQRFALDVLKLNPLGMAARGLAPRELERYSIFGDTLYSPCTGRVMVARDGLPDLPPPERDGENLAGNHVVIACQGVKVLLAHLQQGSVAVMEGEEVAVGQRLGRVGNSGNTTQPHLHIHAERGGTASSILDGEGVPIRFDGRFLVRNSLVRRRS